MALELPEPENDGLHMDEVGAWSADKHHFLRRYIDAFTTAMKGKRWTSLHYIDLFAGPGILRIKNGGFDWGSPLIAAQSSFKFARLHLCELGTAQFAALKTRISRIPQPNAPQLIQGDANKEVHAIVTEIPKGALCLVFLDPHGLHLHFNTLRVLSALRADLIIFFPDHLDALRNWEKVYHDQDDSNLDLVLGTAIWRERMRNVPRERWAELLQGIYTDQIRSLGYKFFADERISRKDGVFLYKLIFCSKDPSGETIWRGISKKKPDGQYGLFE